MANIKKAIELINSFANGDTNVAKALLTPDYIQHNLAVPTGRDAFIDIVKQLSTAPIKTTVENIRAFEDGDYVVLHSIYNFAGKGAQVAFDIFRFENDKIAEHWDNCENIAPANLSGHTQTDGATEVVDLDNTEANKKMCEKFIKEAIIGGKTSKLLKYIKHGDYIQHNIHITDRIRGLVFASIALSKADIKVTYNRLHMVLGQGNFVIAIAEGSFNKIPTVFYDLWRVEDGKLAEHWDILESIPDDSTWAHNNGKF